MIKEVEVLGTSEILEDELITRGFFAKMSDMLSFIQEEMETDYIDIEGNNVYVTININSFDWKKEKLTDKVQIKKLTKGN